MTITENLHSILSFWFKLPQQKITQTICVLLFLYITSLLAEITWLLIPQQRVENHSIVVSDVTQKNQSKIADISALESLNLFGQYNAAVEEVAEQIQNAPETRLKLTLAAAVASDEISTAAAIIEYQGKQETYGIGDKIVGTRASLEQVLIDRVIIKQSGRLETLMLDGANYTHQAQTVVNKKLEIQQNKANKIGDKNSSVHTNVVDQRLNKELTRNAANLRADLNSNPSKITDYMRIYPKRKQGKIVGYTLSPGKKPEFFKLSGLKSGDVAVQMNGYDLRNPLEAVQALSALKTERDMSLLVERKHDLINILFSIE